MLFWDVVVSHTVWRQNERIVPCGIVTVAADTREEAMHKALQWIYDNPEKSKYASSIPAATPPVPVDKERFVGTQDSAITSFTPSFRNISNEQRE